MESSIVSVDDLKKYTSIGQNLDCELLYPHLLISQQLYLEPVLGKCLYEDIIYRFDNNQLTGDTQELYELYIIPAVGFGAWYGSAPFLHIRTSRSGVNKSGTDTLTPVELDEFSMYLSKIENLKSFYLNRLEDYLICNKAKFPLYCQNSKEQSNGGSLYLGFRQHPRHSDYWDSTGIDSLLGNGNCGCPGCPDC